MFNFGSNKSKKIKTKEGSLVTALLEMMSALKPHSTDYCNIYTTYGTDTLVLDNYSLMSLIKLNGLKTVLSVDQHDLIIQYLADDCAEIMRKTGYQLHFLFRRDNFSDHEIEEVSKRKKQTAQRVGLVGLDALIDEDAMIARERVYHEEMYIACVTNIGALDKIEREISEQETREQPPAIAHGQNPFNVSSMLYQKHKTFFEQVFNSLNKKEYSFSAEPCNVVSALRAIKTQIEPNTGRDWTPKIIIDREKLPDSEHQLKKELANYRLYDVEPFVANANDASHMMPAPLAEQLITEELNEATSGNAPVATIKYGNKLYSCMVMNHPPARPKTFASLFDSLNQFSVENEHGVQRLMPWSVCFSLQSNAMPSATMKHMLGQFLKSIPPVSNREIYDSLSELKYHSEHNVAIVGMQIAFMTWAEDTPEGENKLRIQKMRLINALENWGGLSVSQNTGDNYLMWQANHLITDKKVGGKTLLPLVEAFRMMPFERPASVYKNPSIFYNTVDGKSVGKEIWSPLQKNQFHVITGGAGRGKSVLANDIMLEHCLQPGLQELPYLLIIDKGASSEGLLSTLKEALRPEMRHLIEFKELHNSEKTCINPFDIKVGLSYPLPDEITRLKAFLMALISPPGKSADGSLLSNAISMLIDKAYRSKSRDDVAKFNNTTNEELTKLLLDLDFFGFYANIPEGAPKPLPDWHSVQGLTMFELSERCHKIGEQCTDRVLQSKYYRARDLAHRYAVPCLRDLVGLLVDSEFVTAFGDAKTQEQMSLPQYIKQVINSSIEEYPAFSSYTNFDVSTSKVLALELNNVLSITSPKQNSLFLQIALMVGLKKMALTKEDINRFPPAFKDYYTEEWKRLNDLSKIVYIDEFKNGSKDKNFMDTINTGGAEWRKFKIATYLASQHISDFIYNDGVTEINLLMHVTQVISLEQPKQATSGNQGKTNYALYKEQFSVHEDVMSEMANMGMSPVYGSMFFTHIITSENKYDIFLCRKVGNRRLWALNTSPTNKSIRAAVVEIASSYSEAISALEFTFGASAEDALSLKVTEIEKSKDTEENKLKKMRLLMDTTAREVLSNYHQYLAYRRAEEKEMQRKKYEEDQLKMREAVA